MEKIKVLLRGAYLPMKSLLAFVFIALALVSVNDFLVSAYILTHTQASLLLLTGAMIAIYGYVHISKASYTKHQRDSYAWNIMNNSPEMVWAINTEYKLLFFNEAFRSSMKLFSGHDCRPGDDVLAINMAEDNSKWKELYNKALRGISFTFQDSISASIGTASYENSFQPLKSPKSGQIEGVTCVSRDITWKVDQEKKLKESNEKLEMVLEGADLGIWDLNVQTWEAQYNEQLKEMLGYSADEMDGSQATWQSLVYPADLEAALGSIKKHINGETEMIDMEYRMRHKDGHWVWIHNRGKVMERHAGGRPVRALGTHLDITHRKLAEAELQKLSLVASKTHNGVVITDANARVIWVNDAYEKMTGFSLSEVAGTYPADAASQPDADTEVVKRIKEKLARRQIIQEEVIYHNKNGEKIWVALEITPIFDAMGNLERFISIETDITERKKQDNQRVILEAAVKNIAEAVLIISKPTEKNDSLYRVVYSNDAFFKMTGFSSEEVEHKNPINLLRGPKSDSEKLTKVFEAIANEDYIQEDLVSYKKNGESFCINLAVSPVGDLNHNNKHYFVAIVKDISERKQAQSDAQGLTNELVARNKELQEFTQIVSHNLRAPVVNILGLTQIFDKSQAFNPYNLKILKHLTESAQQLDTILIDLNDILQVKESSTQVKQKFILKDLIQQVLSSFMLQIEESGAKISVQADESIQLEVIRGYAHSIIHNLTTNALKYRHPRRPLELEVTSYTTEADLVLWVKDNGLGMDTKQIEGKLFKLYKRFHSHVEGKGMGLFLVKTQVERMGGTIKVFSTLGKGTAFRVTIPRENCLVEQEEMQYALEVK
ncbi:PAS domain S-box protein [uncultured Imperialibacter sp.]|uniref:PAS domain-containing sensor histidine kinase n=1 Tax=uncultured Imperialibacter sp. TaxID=1672639 RepID=UPI0030DD9CD7|tara:strand:+ start:68676 stop:71171 length:2496 start_codon:yes stop_codon:yes gene_type:complete